MTDQPTYYLPDSNVADFTDAQLLASLQHYHYERSLKFKRKASQAMGKPYYPLLRNIEIWHHNMANYLNRVIDQNQ